TVSDDNGATTSTVVTVTVHGSNDAPALAAGVQTGSVTEAGTGVTGTAVATGDVNITDVDDAAHSYSAGTSGTYGTFAIDSASGAWTYTLDNARPATQALDSGESVLETFTVTVTDDNGASTSTVVTVTVHGSDDGPTSAGGVTTGSVTEAGTGVAGTATATGDVNVADADDTTHVFSSSGSATYGTFTIDSASGA